jgi:hypothetical protein
MLNANSIAVRKTTSNEDQVRQVIEEDATFLYPLGFRTRPLQVRMLTQCQFSKVARHGSSGSPHFSGDRAPASLIAHRSNHSLILPPDFFIGAVL